MRATDDIILTQIGSSALYAPPAAPGVTWVFLLWNTASAPKTVLLSQTWSDHGEPQRLGDYIFLLSIPTASEAPALEQSLRDVFPPPTDATAFGWYKSKSAAWPVATALIDDEPAVAADVEVPAGSLQFYFMKELPIVAATNGLLFTRPRPAPAAAAYGVTIPLSGQHAGCIVLLGALQSTVIGDQTIKELADVRIDPLRLTNKDRTRITPAGVKYVLSGSEAAGYHFLPYSP